MIDQRLKLGGSVADLCVLHEHDPAVASGVPDPFFVAEPLADPLAVDVGHGVDDSAGSAKGLRDDVPPEAAVDEELRRRVGGQLG